MPEPNLIHCSYHKCLTVYYKRVMHAVFNRCLPLGGGYAHHNSHLADFYGAFERLRVASVNNRCLDLERLGRFRLSRFVRDPRDLLVSGFFYHRRGAEAWVTQPAPTEDDWYFANAAPPEALRGQSISYAEHLQSLSDEDGLLAELEVRTRHFDSMAAWPEEHPDIVTFRYEDILGNEERVFGELFEHYGLGPVARGLGGFFVRRYSLKGRAKANDPHVRNPTSGQWREHFTPKVRAAFNERYGDLVERLGYPRS